MDNAPRASPAFSGQQDRTVVENIVLFLAAYLAVIYAILPFFVLCWTKSIERTRALFGRPSVWAGVLTSINWLLYSLAVLKTEACLELAISYSLILMAGSAFLFVDYGNDATKWEGIILSALLVPSIGFFIFVIHFEFILPEWGIIPLGILGLVSLVFCHFFQICDIQKISGKLEIVITALTLISSVLINIATVYITTRWHPDHYFILGSSFVNLTCNAIEFLMLCKAIQDVADIPPAPPSPSADRSIGDGQSSEVPKINNTERSSIQGAENEQKKNVIQGSFGQGEGSSNSKSEHIDILVVPSHDKHASAEGPELCPGTVDTSEVNQSTEKNGGNTLSNHVKSVDTPDDSTQSILGSHLKSSDATNRVSITEFGTVTKAESDGSSKILASHLKIPDSKYGTGRKAVSDDEVATRRSSKKLNSVPNVLDQKTLAESMAPTVAPSTEKENMPILQDKTRRKGRKIKQKPVGSVPTVEERHGLFCLPRVW